ncbi:hypothetical protein ABLO27_03040 [Roseibium sp. SCPC15]|uniref:YybH family protein n=1 Tax=Roseibium sp. SCP15 TaxID=3141376 RepID=UPI00333791BD
MNGSPEFKDECQNLFNRYVDFYRSADAAGCSLMFEPEAELYSPYGPPAIGRAAIAATHGEWVQEGGENKDINVLSADCDGDLGWCVARFSEGTDDSGTSVNVLARQADGSWLIKLCSLNET